MKDTVMLRRILLASVAAFGLAGSAFAADLPSRAPPPIYVPPAPIFTWTGLYLGGHIGYAWDNNNLTGWGPYYAFSGVNYAPSGVIGGAHVGYNLQLSQFVIGLEGDVDGTSQSKQFNGSLPFGSTLVGGGVISAPLGGNININVNTPLLWQPFSRSIYLLLFYKARI